MKPKTKFKQTEIGMIPEDWNTIRGDECIELEIGSRPKGGIKKGGTIPSLGGEHIDLLSHKIDFFKSPKYITKEFFEKMKRGKLKKEDILINKDGAYTGKIAFVWDLFQKEIAINEHLFILRSNEKINQKFLFYYLISNYGQYQIRQNITGSAQPGLNTQFIKKLLLPLPTIKEQENIVNLLSSLDKKINLIQKQNKTLEKIGQAIFKHWFVDFEFPNEEGKPYKSSGGDMVYNEGLGKEIPKGWKVGKLGEIANISIGRTPPRKESKWFSTNKKDWKWISIKDLGNSGVYILDTSECLTDEAVNKFNIPKIPKNTVILSFKLTIGRVAITTKEMLSNEAIAHIKLVKQDLTTEYIYLFLKQFNFRELGSTSSIATAINSKMIKQIQVLMPLESIVKSFTKDVATIFKKLRINAEQIQTLQKTRDLLLPKLMTGKIRVPVEVIKNDA